MGQILIDQDDNNKTFDAKIGDTIIITVRENPTTGYRWKLAQIDEETILMEDSKYRIDLGSAARTFTFKVGSLGKTKIRLHLKREWEKSPIDQFIA